MTNTNTTTDYSEDHLKIKICSFIIITSMGLFDTAGMDLHYIPQYTCQDPTLYVNEVLWTSYKPSGDPIT